MILNEYRDQHTKSELSKDLLYSKSIRSGMALHNSAHKCLHMENMSHTFSQAWLSLKEQGHRTILKLHKTLGNRQEPGKFFHRRDQPSLLGKAGCNHDCTSHPQVASPRSVLV